MQTEEQIVIKLVCTVTWSVLFNYKSCNIEGDVII